MANLDERNPGVKIKVNHDKPRKRPISGCCVQLTKQAYAQISSSESGPWTRANQSIAKGGPVIVSVRIDDGEIIVSPPRGRSVRQ